MDQDTKHNDSTMTIDAEDHTSSESKRVKSVDNNVDDFKSDKKVYLFHNEDISLYQHSNNHLMKPFRAKLVYDMMNSLYPSPPFSSLVDSNDQPKLASRTDIGQYHADNYIALLQISDNHLFSLNYRLKQSDNDISEQMQKSLEHFNLATENNPLFPGIYEYSRL